MDRLSLQMPRYKGLLRTKVAQLGRREDNKVGEEVGVLCGGMEGIGDKREKLRPVHMVR